MICQLMSYPNHYVKSCHITLQSYQFHEGAPSTALAGLPGQYTDACHPHVLYT